MKILGPEAITYGVDDMDAGRRFWTDFGLDLVEETADRLYFECADGGSVTLRPIGASDLRPAVIEGPTAREFVWGVESAGDLEEIADALAGQPDLAVDKDGVHVTDPNGYALLFRVSQRRELNIAPTEFNNPGARPRINKPGEAYETAKPLSIEHIVCGAPKFQECYDFYVGLLQFRLTDSYPGDCWFFRANGGHAHHQLFFMRWDNRNGFDHVAFEVRDIHEIMGGGTAMTDKGWKTQVGPGRHPISGSYFWYFENPCGGSAEYDWDTNCVDDNWEPREWPREKESFAEWSLPDGIGKFKIATGDSGVAT